MKPTKASQIVDYFDAQGIEIRSYSGRGMFGRKCLAIEEEPRKLFKMIAEILRSGEMEGDTDDLAEFVETIGDFSQDQMGRGVVLYWPRIAWDFDKTK